MSYDKICTRCRKGFNQPLDKFFYKKKGSKDGLQHVCKICTAVLHSTHYKQKKEYYKEKASRHNKKYRRRNQEFLLKYLSEHPCVDCGQNNTILLEFDHQKDKLYDVSKMLTMSEETIKQEIAKCDVRCSFCHRIRTATQFNWYANVRPEVFNEIIKTHIIQVQHLVDQYKRDANIISSHKGDASFQNSQIHFHEKQIVLLTKLLR